MKLRNHTISVSKISYIGTFLLISMIFGFLVTGNISRAHAEDEVNAVENDGSEAISDNHYVTFHENGESLTIKTDAKTVGDAIARAKIEISESDQVDPALGEAIDADNYHINIYRARPVIIMDGAVKKFIMSASYDADTLAKQAGLKLYDGDKIKEVVNTSQILEAGLTNSYKVERAGGTTVTVEEDIPYATKTEPDKTLAAGQQKVKQIGVFGKRVTTYEVKFQNGVEVERNKISDEDVKQPVDRIVLVGTKVSAVVPNPDRATCIAWIRAAGVPESQVENAYWIIERESHCRYNARNASSGAYGIPQALPGDKMKSAGADWETNPVTQIRWMNSYVKRYGGWEGAVAFWREHHWY